MQKVQSLLDATTASIAVVESKTKALRAKRDALVGKIAPLEEQVRELSREIQAIEAAGDDAQTLYDLKQTHAALTRAIGGKRMSAESAGS